MPDDVDSSSAFLTRMGERLAALEARTQAEIGALKRDTEMIRTGVHEVNNRAQEWFALIKVEQTLLRDHVEVCNKRGARLEKISYLAILLLIGTMGFLLKVHFFPGAS